jgi:ABC-type ATPase involved in cell division
MLQGLQQPTEGEVLFRNEDWLGEDLDRHFRMRSRIGRVFEDRAWIQNFNVLDNVTLASRHHRIADANINQQVKAWADRFDVAAISHHRPSFVDPTSLQIYQWIRALICKPALLILERPMNLVPTAKLSKLVDAINEIRKQGAAVIWFTSDVKDVDDGLRAPRIDYVLSDGNLRNLLGGSADE